MHETRSTPRSLWAPWVAAVVVGSSLLAAGCARDHYRRQADREVYSLIDCGARDPRWQLRDYTILPDPHSRLFDPSCPDYPPMPPDDPTSHKLMHCVDGKKGWAHWHDSGNTPYVENPSWERYLPVGADGTLVLDRQAAVEMSLLHSRSYQQELEDLYLSALNVTFERFRFDAQFFGGNDTFFKVDGPLSGSAVSDSLLTTDTNTSVRRALATGGELVAGVANSVLWEFGGSNSYRVSTPITLALTQPLLRTAGRAIALEDLTQSERNLLADIRQMERFRRGFYARVVAGRGGVSGPTPTGIRIPSAAGLRFDASGFLGLLEEQVRIRNLEDNVAGNQSSLNQMEALFEAGKVNNQQVELIRQSLLRSQSQLLSTKAGYQRLLDDYKITLGLPPELKMRIEDPLLRPFDLIDPAMSEASRQVDGLLAEFREILVTAAQQSDRKVAVTVQIPADWHDRLNAVAGCCRTQLPMVEQDLQRFVAALPARRQYMTEIAQREEVQRKEVDPTICSVETLDRDRTELEENVAAYQSRIEQLLDKLDETRIESDTAAALASGSLAALVDLLRQLSEAMLELSLTQARTRLGTITLLPIEITSEEAIRIARQNRLDWMNARAALVDQWRQIEVAANALKSDLDIVVDGRIDPLSNNLSSGTAVNNTTGELRFGLEFDAPLTRLAERNAYRRALIAYQQARRSYYAFEDGVKRNLRELLRQIRVSQLDFELQRQAVLVAIRRVDQTQLGLNAPQAASGGAGGGRSTSARDVQEALQSLLNTRNQFIAVWVAYEARRINLDLDLGTMRLDDRSLWIDPGPITSGYHAADTSPEAIPPGQPLGPFDAPPLPAVEAVPSPLPEPPEPPMPPLP